MKIALLVLGGDEIVDGVANPCSISNGRSRRSSHWLERPPAVGSEEFAELLKLRRGVFQFCGRGFVVGIAGAVAEEDFGEIIDPIAITVLVGNGGDAGGDVRGFAGGGQFFLQRPQSRAKRIVRKFIEALRIFIVAGPMAGGAGIEISGQEAIEMTVEGGLVGGCRVCR